MNKVLKKYVIVCQTNMTELEKYVNERISQGWECQGGLNIDPKTDWLVQPMVLYNKESK